MNTAPTTITTETHRRSASRAVVVLLSLLLLAVALPAAAQPVGPTDEILLPPEPPPVVTLQAWDGCDPTGIHFEMDIVGPDRPYTARVDWNNGSQAGESGFLPADEGTYQLTAVVVYPQVQNEVQVWAALLATSTPVEVTIDCTDDTPPPPPPNGGGGGGGDDIVLATPNFTG